MTLITHIEQERAGEAILQRDLMASAIALCFSGSKEDPLGKELERVSKFDPDEIIESERQDISKMRAMFLTKYPHLHRGKARVNSNGR